MEIVENAHISHTYYKFKCQLHLFGPGRSNSAISTRRSYYWIVGIIPTFLVIAEMSYLSINNDSYAPITRLSIRTICTHNDPLFSTISIISIKCWYHNVWPLFFSLAVYYLSSDCLKDYFGRWEFGDFLIAYPSLPVRWFFLSMCMPHSACPAANWHACIS